MARATTIGFRAGARGYVLVLGRFAIPQSTYLIVAAVLVGVGGGFGAIAFRALIEFETHLAFGVLVPALGRFAGAFALVGVVALGGAIAAEITERFAPEARGHGVPEVMAAVALRGGVMRPRVIAIKALASATSIGFGGSCGREGPIVQIGSAIGSVLGQIARAPAPIVRTLVACGAAAGISATFNAPIGGVFFASEVILGDFAPRSFATIVVASVVAAVISRAYLGNTPSFDASGFALVSPRELPLYALLGLLCALWAWGFVRLLYAFEDFVDGIRAPAMLKGAIGFGVLGAIGLAAPQILGVGYGAIQHVFDEHIDARRALLLSVLKPVATSITLGSGGSGGVFAPSLFTGAMLGDGFGRIVHDVFPLWTGTAAGYGLVAMAGVFAAAAEAPITAIVIVFEMSGDYRIILPLMICTVISSILGRRFLGSTIYEMKLIRRGIDWKRVRRPHALAHLPVESVTQQVPGVGEDESLASVLAQLRNAVAGALVLVDAAGRATGILDGRDIDAHPLDATVTIRTLARPVGATIAASDSLERAAGVFADADVRVLPVVAKDGRFVGILTPSDVLGAYRSLTEV